MQKKLIALAIASMVAAPAFAADNVTVYGVMGVNYTSSTVGNFSQTQLKTGGHSGSRLGFKGTEDLGGGMKALFVLETALAIDNGAGTGAAALATVDGTTMGDRQAFVGLSSNMGTLTFGRQYNLNFDLAASIDSLGAADWTTAFYGVQHAGVRENNSALYVSPTFGGGFTVKGMYFLGEGTTDVTKAHGDGQALSLRYSNGPIYVGLGYTKEKDRAGAFLGDDNYTSLVGSYDFGVAKVSLGWQRFKNFSSVTGLTDSTRGTTAGISAPVGASGTFALQYGKSDVEAANSDVSGWGVQYNHRLSKRTDVYVAYARANTDAAFAGGAQVSALAGTGVNAPVAGDDSRVTVVGLRHTF